MSEDISENMIRKTIHQKLEKDKKLSKEDYTTYLFYFMNNQEAFLKFESDERTDVFALKTKAQAFQEEQDAVDQRVRGRKQVVKESSDSQKSEMSSDLQKQPSDFENDSADDIGGQHKETDEQIYDVKEVFAAFQDLIVSPAFILKSLGKYYLDEILPYLVLLIPGDVLRRESTEQIGEEAIDYNFGVRISEINLLQSFDQQVYNQEQLKDVAVTISQPQLLSGRSLTLDQFLVAQNRFGERLEPFQMYQEIIAPMQLYGDTKKIDTGIISRKAQDRLFLDIKKEDIFKYGPAVQILLGTDHSEKLYMLNCFLFGTDVDPLNHSEAISQLKMRLGALFTEGRRLSMSQTEDGFEDEAIFPSSIRDQIKRVEHEIQKRKTLLQEQTKTVERDISFVGRDRFYDYVATADMVISEFQLMNGNALRKQHENVEHERLECINNLEINQEVVFDQQNIVINGKSYPRNNLLYRCDVVRDQKYVGKAVFVQKIWVQGRVLFKFRIDH